MAHKTKINKPRRRWNTVGTQLHVVYFAWNDIQPSSMSSAKMQCEKHQRNIKIINKFKQRKKKFLSVLLRGKSQPLSISANGFVAAHVFLSFSLDRRQVSHAHRSLPTPPMSQKLLWHRPRSVRSTFFVCSLSPSLSLSTTISHIHFFAQMVSGTVCRTPNKFRISYFFNLSMALYIPKSVFQIHLVIWLYCLRTFPNSNSRREEAAWNAGMLLFD